MILIFSRLTRFSSEVGSVKNIVVQRKPMGLVASSLDKPAEVRVKTNQIRVNVPSSVPGAAKDLIQFESAATQISPEDAYM